MKKGYSEVDDEKRAVSLSDFFKLTAAFAGAQIAWSVQIGFATVSLEEFGSLSDSTVSFVWLSGPLSGIVVQPIIGALSDNSRYGRTPFVLGGSLAVLISMIVFAHARSMFSRVISFWMLDVAIDVMQVRANYRA
jgi:solute carrier family 45, member 1/2/4